MPKDEDDPYEATVMKAEPYENLYESRKKRTLLFSRYPEAKKRDGKDRD